MKHVLRPSFDRFVRRVGVVLSAFGLALPALATDYTWSKSVTEGNWSDPASWGKSEAGEYPQSDDVAKVTSGAAINLGGGTYTVGKFQPIAAGANVTISNGTLTSNGALGTSNTSGTRMFQLVGAEGRLTVAGPETKVDIVNSPAGNNCHWYIGNGGAITVKDGAKLRVKELHASDKSWYGSELKNWDLQVTGEGSLFTLGFQYSSGFAVDSTITVSEGGELQMTGGVNYSGYGAYLGAGDVLTLDNGTLSHDTTLWHNNKGANEMNNGSYVQNGNNAKLIMKGANPLLKSRYFATIGNGGNSSVVEFHLPDDPSGWESEPRIQAGLANTANKGTVTIGATAIVRVYAENVPVDYFGEQGKTFPLAKGLKVDYKAPAENVSIGLRRGLVGRIALSNSNKQLDLTIRPAVVDDFSVVADEYTTVASVVINGEDVPLDALPETVLEDDEYVVTYALKPGCKWVSEDETGIVRGTAEQTTIVIVPPKAQAEVSGVAQIGDKGYKTLEDAFAAAQSGDLILLLGDVTLTNKISVAKALTLELKGKTVTGREGDAASVFVLEGGALTIDGTSDGSTMVCGLAVGQNDQDNGVLIINGGTYMANKSDEAVVFSSGSCTNVTITATGATFTSTDDTFYLAAGGTYTLANCTVDGATGIYLNGGDLTLTGCTVASTGDCIIVDAKMGYTGQVSVTLAGAGNVITSENGYAIREAYTDAQTTALNALTVDGGTLSGEKGAFVASEYFDAALTNDPPTATSTIKAGTFSHEISQVYLISNRKCYQRQDGTWGTSPIVDDRTTTYTWVGGSTGDWFDTENWDPKASDTVAGVPNSGYARAKIPQTATIDLGGWNVDLDTSSNQGLVLTAGKTVTLTNGLVTLPAKVILDNCRLCLKDGGRIKTSGECCVFSQNGYNGVLELAGNATVQGDVNTYTYNSDKSQASIGNTILVQGDNNEITGNVMNQNGRMLVDVREGSLDVKGLNVWGAGGYPLELSVSNATVNVGSFGANHAGSQTQNRRKFDVFIPAGGFAEAPISVSTKYDLTTAAYFELTTDPSFVSGWVPLIKGIKSIPDVETLIAHTTYDTKHFSGVEYALRNEVLFVKLKGIGFVVIVK